MSKAWCPTRPWHGVREMRNLKPGWEFLTREQLARYEATGELPPRVAASEHRTPEPEALPAEVVRYREEAEARGEYRRAALGVPAGQNKHDRALHRQLRRKRRGQ